MDQSNRRFIFTDRAIRLLKPGRERVDYRDLGCPGLTLRVSLRGIKTWRWQYRGVDGKHKLLTLGKYPELSLAQARRMLEEEKQRLGQKRAFGADHYVELKTVGDLARDFFSLLKTTRKRPEEAWQMIEKEILPKLGRLPLNPPPHPPVIGAVIKQIVARGAPVHAGKVLNLVKQMFEYGVGSGHLPHNPASSLKGPALGVQKFTSRDRWLRREEIVAFWRVLDEVPRVDDRTKLALKLLLLTGVRSQELRLAKWPDVDFEASRWTIPVANQKLTLSQAKTAKPFVIPLAPFAKEQFCHLKQLSNGSDWVLCSDSSASGHYDEKALGKVVRRLFEKKISDAVGNKVPLLDVAKFSPHDLRRTMRSHLGSTLNVAPHIAELCLNHSLGTIIQTYDRGDYFEERAQAMTRWAEYVSLAVRPQANVTYIERTPV